MSKKKCPDCGGPLAFNGVEYMCDSDECEFGTREIDDEEIDELEEEDPGDDLEEYINSLDIDDDL